MLLLVAQAVTIGRQEPFALYFIAIMPPQIFEISIGIKNGETFLGPFSKSFFCSAEKVSIPPIPEPM